MINKIIISGTVVDKPVFSHSSHNEDFYEVAIESERLSGTIDRIICIVPALYIHQIKVGCKNRFLGEVRTRNMKDTEKMRLKIFVFVKYVDVFSGEKDENEVEIAGYIAKQPEYRLTPMGREITDFVIANNSFYASSNYIPTIVWGRKAQAIKNEGVGTLIVFKGRLQSREYLKRYEDGTEEIKMAYELSVNHLREEIEDED